MTSDAEHSDESEKQPDGYVGRHFRKEDGVPAEAADTEARVARPHFA